MKKDIKLIAFDIDGTLITDDLKVLDQTKNIIKKIKEKGIQIVLCTGRSFNGFYWIREELGLVNFDDYSITCTGAFVRQNATGKALIKKVLNKNQAEEILEKLDDDRIDATIHTRDILYNKVQNPNKHFINDQQKMRMPWLRYESLEDIDLDLARVCFEADTKVLDEFEKRHKTDFEKSFRYMRNDINIIEILNKYAGKSAALKALAKMLDLEMENVMYFGDGANDVKSIKAAGVGVAMANGRSAAKEAADFVIGDNNEPSIANFLKEYFYE